MTDYANSLIETYREELLIKFEKLAEAQGWEEITVRSTNEVELEGLA